MDCELAAVPAALLGAHRTRPRGRSRLPATGGRRRRVLVDRVPRRLSPAGGGFADAECTAYAGLRSVAGSASNAGKACTHGRRGCRLPAELVGGRGSRAHCRARPDRPERPAARSEEHTSELQSLMRISYAVFCLKKK